MSDAARAWVAAHAAGVPSSLQARMEEAAHSVAAQQNVPAELAAAALDCLRTALHRCDERAAALHLLAADALMTYACAVSAEAGNDALAALCDEFTTTRLHMLVAEHIA